MGKQSGSLLTFLKDYLADLKANGKMGTHDKVNATLLKLKTYLDGRDISFDDFDLSFLKKYERYLRDELGNAPNTIHSNLKIFRKIYNDAVREDIVELSPKPIHQIPAF